MPDHHLCRPREWYHTVTNPVVKNSSAFKALLSPHKQVHDLGKAALRKYHEGDVDGALAVVEDLRVASDRVLELLDDLTELLMQHDSAGMAEMAAE